jgi:hypothetical protein
MALKLFAVVCVSDVGRDCIMSGYIRDFADPLDGLLMQLDELRGFARTVPRLIDADRQATWEKVASSPGDADEDILDAFAREAGEGTGGGFADFGRTVYSAALVIGWEVFRDYLALHLAERQRLPERLGGRRTVRDDLEMKLTELPLHKLAEGYGRLGIMLDQLPGWKAIREIQFTRNAIVHNLGRYTPQYFEKVEEPRYPPEKEMPWGFATATSKEELQDALIDREEIPLDYDYVSGSLATCAAFAREINMKEGS